MEEQNPFDSLYDCHMCHQAPIDKTENPDSVLCKNCREKAIHYPFPKLFLPIAVILCILTVFAYLRMPENLADYRIYATAEKQIQQGNLYDTLMNLEEVASRHPGSTDVAVRLVTLSMDYGCYDIAAYSMNTYLVGKSLSDVVYGDMIHYQNVLESFYDTQDSLSEFFNTLDESLSEEERRTALQNKILEMKADSKMYKPLVYYFAANFSSEPEEIKENLLQATSYDFLNFDALSNLGTTYRREGDFDAARSCYEKVLRYERKEPSANRGMAILEMLDGNMEQGLAYARTAYENGPDAYYVRETYLIALSLNGQAAQAGQIREEITAAGETFDPKMDSLLNGDISLEDYYIGEE